MKKPADPILIEVLRNEMGAIAEEMAIAVYKTARSSMLRVGDFATSLADYQGRIVGLGQSHTMATSVFMHLMPHITRKFAGDLKPGDVILANDPYSGASHMPDVILIMPVFHRAQISGFVIIYSHQTDIGGRFPGGFSSQCTETYEEGIRLPNLKLYEAGVRNEPLVQLLKANIRAADEWMGDIDAKLSGCRRGIRDFEAVLEKYGLDDVNACFDYLVDYAEEAARKAIATVPPGDYSREIFMRDDGFGSEGVAMPIRLTLRFRPDRLIVDFTGTAPQARGAINMPFSNTLGQVYSTVHKILAPTVVFNAGFVKPIEVVAPEGTLANPKFPAAVGGRAPLFFLITEVDSPGAGRSDSRPGRGSAGGRRYRPHVGPSPRRQRIHHDGPGVGRMGRAPAQRRDRRCGHVVHLGARRTGRARSAGGGGGLRAGSRYRRRRTPSRLAGHLQELPLPPSGKNNGAHQSPLRKRGRDGGRRAGAAFVQPVHAA